MIDNKLKQCCENCNYLDIYTSQEARSYMNIKPGESSLHTYIGCTHMHVCKQYIEETERN